MLTSTWYCVRRNIEHCFLIISPCLSHLCCSCFLMALLLPWACLCKNNSILNIPHWNPSCFSFISFFLASPLPLSLKTCLGFLFFFLTECITSIFDSDKRSAGSYRFWMQPIQQKCMESWKECRHSRERKVLTTFLCEHGRIFWWLRIFLCWVTLGKMVQARREVIYWKNVNRQFKY